MKRIPTGVRNKAKRIKLLLLDVDGVLTDGAIIIDDRGVETKRFHVRDGQGLALLKKSGIEVGLITGRRSKVVRYRAKELGIRILYEGMKNKADAYKDIKRKNRLKDEQIAYAGDDVTDVPVLEQAGLAMTVRDCWPGLRMMVDYITEEQGGRGAVREISELLLGAQDRGDARRRSVRSRAKSKFRA